MENKIGETEFKMERERGCKIDEGKISLDVHTI